MIAPAAIAIFADVWKFIEEPVIGDSTTARLICCPISTAALFRKFSVIGSPAFVEASNVRINGSRPGPKTQKWTPDPP